MQMTGSKEDPFATGAGLGIFASLTDAGAESLIGRELDGYRITEFLAEGGMSRVYRAQRVDGRFERDVAIKLSTVSGFSPAMRDRFTQEQGVLAGLNHPHISQLYDARITDEGWPYIVMELVAGRPITEFCDDQSLDIEERLGLMIDVVDAVAYAHENLVVHRDIKPSNVLVTRDGKVKLLDFGIAKLLANEPDNVTRTNAMTPRYASPEQLLGKPISVTSDIYQLGLLIYQVATNESLSDTDTLSDAIGRAAGRQSLTVPLSARRQLPKDLALVIEQCLRADPEERYRAASSLKADLQAIVDGYPVAAAGRATGYRLVKLIQRNKIITATVAAALVSVIGSTLWYTIEVTRQRDAAAEQQQLAEESLDFLASFYSAANPDRAQGRTLTALDLLAEGTERIELELADQPAIQSRLYEEVAETYRRLSQFDRALDVIDKGLNATRKAYPGDPNAALPLRMIEANILRQQGRPEDAAAIYRDILAVARSVSGPGSETALRARHNLSITMWQTGLTDSAIDELQSVLANKIQAEGVDSRTTLVSASALVTYLRAAGELDEAIATGERYLPIARIALGEHHSVTLDLETNLALALGNRDGPAASIPLLEVNVAGVRTVHGMDSFEHWHRYSMLAKAHINAGNIDPWIEELKTATDQLSTLRGPENSSVLINKASLASALLLVGKATDAIPLLDDVLDVQERTIGLDHPNAFFTQVVRSRAEMQIGSPGSVARARVLHDRMTERLGADHVLTKMLSDSILDQ
jgi:serine/threonine-protein kinase